MFARPFGFKFYGSLSVAGLGALLIYLCSLAQAPDFDLQMIRDFPSKLSPQVLSRSVDSIQNWPEWLYSVSQVKVVNSHGDLLPLSDQTLAPGKFVKLFVDPKKGPWSRFEVLTEVKQYKPKKILELQVLGDSKGKLNKLFSSLVWKIEFLPATTSGSTIRATISAHTSHWRSRLFGKIATRILLTQVFYGNMMRLAEIDQPVFANPFAAPE